MTAREMYSQFSTVSLPRSASAATASRLLDPNEAGWLSRECNTVARRLQTFAISHSTGPMRSPDA
jgi:hypothetical protein